MKRFLIFLLVISSSHAGAQIDDTGLWGSVSLKKLVTQRLNLVLTEEIRLFQDLTMVDVVFTDFGLDYELSNTVRFGLNYRFQHKNEFTYYGKRHRIYGDISLKKKLGDFNFTLRERIQRQVENVNSSETGAIPEWRIRTKLTAKWDLNKKYEPFASSELYYILDNAEERDQYFNRIRWSLGFEYEFNRIHALSPFAIYQHNLTEDLFSELVFGFEYVYTF